MPISKEESRTLLVGWFCDFLSCSDAYRYVHAVIIYRIHRFKVLSIFHDYMHLGMATERVTWNRTGAEPLETVPEPEPFATGSEPAWTAKSWNRRKKSFRNRETAGKKLLDPDLRTAGRNRNRNRSGWTCPMVPWNRNRSGWIGPTVPWDRNRSGWIGPTVPWDRNRFGWIGPTVPLEPEPRNSRCNFFYKYTSLSIIFIHNSSLLLLSLLNYAIILLIT